MRPPATKSHFNIVRWSLEYNSRILAIVLNISMHACAPILRGGTGEMVRLPCKRFCDEEARLQLNALAYNLASLLPCTEPPLFG